METSDIPKSAQAAFEKDTIPAVRAFEKQLHASALRDKERLRALVGGNYRDLLSTAEEIVALDQRTTKAEAQISDLGRQCKPPQQETASRSISTFSSTSAQLRLLIQCVTCASTALQTRSVLLCAELLAISRLLLKSLADQQPSPKSTETLQIRAVALRRRLLRLVDSQLSHPSSSIETLVYAICSYCLVNSASSGDAVKHFSQVRLRKLQHRVGADARTQLQAKEDFRYLVASLQMLKSLLGRSVNDALSDLQKQPILQDQRLRKLEVLDIDRLQVLIPQDILAFTPYIKRVLLKQDDIQRLSTEWVKEACQVFAKGLQGVLATTSSMAEVFELRRDFFSTILPVYFSTYAQETLLETVRQETNQRVLELCEAEIATLVQTCHMIVSRKQNTAIELLWEPSLVDQSFALNSAKYVQQVRSNHLGTRGGLTHSIKRVRKWAKQVSQLRSQFQSLESARWQDLLEQPDDEDEDAAGRVIKLLSKDDPKLFKSTLESSMQDAISRFNEILHDASTEIAEAKGNESKSESIARLVYLLRALRESSAILAASVPELKLETKALTSKVHSSLAEYVAEQIMSSLDNATTSHNHVLALPEDLPSPQAFKLLRDICTIMADVGGSDIWSPAAVVALKEKLRAEILDNENDTVDLQSEFDRQYVRAALASQQDTREAANSTDKKSTANAYWQRTKLLFGALG